jgi:hypothetical protein
MVLLACRASLAQQNQGAQPPDFRGIVYSVTDGSFVVVDKDGNSVTVAIGANTSFQAHKNAARLQDVVKVGINIRGTLAADGTAAQVIGSSLADQMSVAQLRVFLNVSDEEWAVISTKIDKIRALRRIASTNNNNGNNNGNGGSNTANAAAAATVGDLHSSLQAAYFDRDSTPQGVSASLTALRQERAQAQANLAAARKDLIGILTPRQEALLVVVGVLE